MTVTEKRNKIIDYANESQEHFLEAYTYLNGNLIQCWEDQFDYIISEEEECCDEYIEELYAYIWGPDKN